MVYQCTAALYSCVPVYQSCIRCTSPVLGELKCTTLLCVPLNSCVPALYLVYQCTSPALCTATPDLTFGPLTSEESPLCRSSHAFILLKTLHLSKVQIFSKQTTHSRNLLFNAILSCSSHLRPAATDQDRSPEDSGAVQIKHFAMLSHQIRSYEGSGIA